MTWAALHQAAVFSVAVVCGAGCLLRARPARRAAQPDGPGAVDSVNVTVVVAGMSGVRSEGRRAVFFRLQRPVLRQPGTRPVIHPPER